MTAAFQTVIFDLDGTLYEEERVYDRYAEELARLIPEARRDGFIHAWSAIKQGEGRHLVGLGYDESRGQLFGHSRGRITHYLTWEGDAVPAQPGRPEEVNGQRLRFGSGHINVGDWWGVLAALAARFGLQADMRQAAFLAVRAHMSSDAGRLRPDANLRSTLLGLQSAGLRLIAMSNSPADTVGDTFDQLEIRDCFTTVVADASKPAGLLHFLEKERDSASVLSVGDNFVNDIEPALDAGAQALYIDRHDTALGRDCPNCVLMPSQEAAQQWLNVYVASTIAG